MGEEGGAAWAAHAGLGEWPRDAWLSIKEGKLKAMSSVYRSPGNPAVLGTAARVSGQS